MRVAGRQRRPRGSRARARAARPAGPGCRRARSVMGGSRHRLSSASAAAHGPDGSSSGHARPTSPGRRGTGRGDGPGRAGSAAAAGDAARQGARACPTSTSAAPRRSPSTSRTGERRLRPQRAALAPAGLEREARDRVRGAVAARAARTASAPRCSGSGVSTNGRRLARRPRPEGPRRPDARRDDLAGLAREVRCVGDPARHRRSARGRERLRRPPYGAGLEGGLLHRRVRAALGADRRPGLGRRRAPPSTPPARRRAPSATRSSRPASPCRSAHAGCWCAPPTALPLGEDVSEPLVRQSSARWVATATTSSRRCS